MKLPTLETLSNPTDEYGNYVLTEAEYDALANEASIGASESGADREYDFDLEAYTDNWIATYLGTDFWYTE